MLNEYGLSAEIFAELLEGHDINGLEAIQIYVGIDPRTHRAPEWEYDEFLMQVERAEFLNELDHDPIRLAEALRRHCVTARGMANWLPGNSGRVSPSLRWLTNENDGLKRFGRPREMIAILAHSGVDMSPELLTAMGEIDSSAETASTPSSRKNPAKWNLKKADAPFVAEIETMMQEDSSLSRYGAAKRLADKHGKALPGRGTADHRADRIARQVPTKLSTN